jgi:8-amino-7-oxononanoate synthase
MAAAIEQGIDIIELKHSAREHIAALSRALRIGLAKLGLSAPSTDTSPIVSTLHGKLSEGLELSAALFSRGFFAEALSRNSPLAEGAAVRFILNAAHTEEQIESLLQAIADVAPKINR